MVIKFIDTQHLVCKHLLKIAKIKSCTYNNPLNSLLNSIKNVNYITQLLSMNLYINSQWSYTYTYLIKNLLTKSFIKDPKSKTSLINTYVISLI